MAKIYNDMMKKEEIKSLIIAALSVLSLFIGLHLDKGVWRTFAILSFMVLLSLSLGAFNGKKKRANRVETVLRIIVAIICLSAFFFGFLYKGLTDSKDGWKYLLVIGFYCLVLVYGVVFYFTPKGWFHRKLRCLEGKTLIIHKLKTKKVMYAVPDDGITIYYYDPSEQFFYIQRQLFTNPLRYEKEFEERKYQFRSRLQLTGLPLGVKEDHFDNPFFFQVDVRIHKSHASETLLKQVKDVLSDISNDDHHLYFTMRVDDEMWHIHSFRYSVVESIHCFMSCEHVGDGIVAEENHTPKNHPEEILYKVLSAKSLDEIEGFSLITTEDFERAKRDDN